MLREGLLPAVAFYLAASHSSRAVQSAGVDAGCLVQFFVVLLHYCSFSGQLGDGAAMYLAEVVNSKGERWEIQFKVHLEVNCNAMLTNASVKCELICNALAVLKQHS
jgi:hypothetical protein